MNYLMVAAVITSLAAPAQSETLGEVCSQLREYAALVMQSHQDGMPKSLVVSSIDDRADKPVRDMLVANIDQAYEFPVYVSPSLIATAASDYGLGVELNCYRDNQ